MEVLKAVILDDEEAAIKNLKNILSNFIAGVEVVASFNDPGNALGEIKSIEFDVLFLDIQMPVLNGFDFLRVLEDVKF